MTYQVKFVDPGKHYRMIQSEIDAAYREVMEKGDLILRGQLKRFEENLAAFVGTKYAVGLNSGYDALHISMIIAGVKGGDEVIVPAHTFLATASAVVNVGRHAGSSGCGQGLQHRHHPNRGKDHPSHQGHYPGPP